MRSLGFDFFRHDEKRHALVGERTKKMYRMGDTLAVRLAEAAPLTGGLRFELAEDEDSASPMRRNASRSRNARRR
jgi:ribonuclease R